MENKNVLIAIVLSTLVIIFWQVMYGDEYVELENQQTKTEETKTKSTKPSAPSISKKNVEIKVSRSDVITQSGRVKIDNQNLKGSITLVGGLIDDITLKSYNSNQSKESKKVVLLNPKEVGQSYYLETGWATSGNEIVPDNQTKWKVVGNKI